MKLKLHAAMLVYAFQSLEKPVFAIQLAMNRGPWIAANQEVFDLAQTQAQYVDLIIDTVKFGIGRLLPVEPVQRQKIHGTKINVAEADKEAETHGGKISGSNNAASMGNPMAGYGPTTQEGFFGGSFFPQSYVEDDHFKVVKLMQESKDKSSDAIMAELASLSHTDEDQILSDVKLELGLDKDQFIKVFQKLGQVTSSTEYQGQTTTGDEISASNDTQ